LLYAILLGFAVSIDSFVAGAAYGAQKIVMPFRSLAIVGLVTAGCVAAAMLAAQFIGRLINLHSAIIAGSLLLIALGIFSLFQEYLTKNRLAQKPLDNQPSRQTTFTLGRLVICIMVKPERADLDHSLSISSFEALLLGLALGVDNIAATFAAGIMASLPYYTPLLMGVLQMLFIFGGYWFCSRLLSAKTVKPFPFLPGAILIFLGLLRLC